MPPLRTLAGIKRLQDRVGRLVRGLGVIRPSGFRPERLTSDGSHRSAATGLCETSTRLVPRPSQAAGSQLGPESGVRSSRRPTPVWLLLPPCHSSSRSEEHTSELQSPCNLVCRLLLEKKKRSVD